jgi:hypothetical protein
MEGYVGKKREFPCQEAFYEPAIIRPVLIFRHFCIKYPCKKHSHRIKKFGKNGSPFIFALPKEGV